MPRPTSALIVDDEPHVRSLLRLILKELGIATCWDAANGVEALELALQHHPDLLILDINLPVMGGLDMLEKLREAGSDVPVVIMTSESMQRTVEQAARLGACAYLLKQSPKSHLQRSLRETIDALAEPGEGGDGAA